MREHSFDVDDLLTELEAKQSLAKPVALLARHLDISKRQVMALIKKARAELEGEGIRIVNNGRGAYYILYTEVKPDVSETSMLRLFET